MHHVLVAVDGSDLAHTAAHYAHDLARAAGRDLVALAVLSPDLISALGETPETLAYSAWPPEGEQLGKRAIREWFDQTEDLCAEAGVCFTRTVDTGQPAERLIWAAMSAHLTVLGAHGSHSPLPHPQGAGLGKTAYQVVRHCLKPMLIVRGEYRPIKRVVFGWDDHPQAAHAAEMVAELGQGQGWEVLVVSGTLPTSPMAQSCSGIAQSLAAAGIAAESVIAEGNAPQVLFDAAARYQPDLLVLGGHRRTARGLLSEGAWLQIVQQAQMPVLLYRWAGAVPWPVAPASRRCSAVGTVKPASAAPPRPPLLDLRPGSLPQGTGPGGEGVQVGVVPLEVDHVL